MFVIDSSWICSYLYKQYLSSLSLWVWIPLRRGVLDTTLCDKVCQWLVAGRWFSPGTPVSSTNKIECHNIHEIFLKVASNTITFPLILTLNNSVRMSKICMAIKLLNLCLKLFEMMMHSIETAIISYFLFLWLILSQEMKVKKS